MSTPDFMMSEEFVYGITVHDRCTFAKGTFVRPIKLAYVPKHVKEKHTFTIFDKEKDVYCYTPQGIFPIPRKYIVQVAGSSILDINSYK